MTLFILFAAFGPGPETARPYIAMNYAAMLQKSDVAVIGVFVSERADRDPIDAEMKSLEKYVEGVTTKLRVVCVLKGEVKSGEVAVRHHRMRREEQRSMVGGGLGNGPMLAAIQAENDYIVFLRKRADGRFECVSGHMDSACSVKRLEPRAPVDLDPRTGKPL